MPALNESIVEDASLDWFLLRSAPLNYCGQVGELGYAFGHLPAPRSATVGHGPHLAPGEPAAERDSFAEVGLVGRLREAIRRMNPAIPQARTLATLRDTLLPKLLSGELSVTETFRIPN